MEHISAIRKKLEELGGIDEEIVNALQEIERTLVLQKEIEKTLYDSELFLVYKHTDPNGKVYVGITKCLPNIRWNEGSGYEKQTKFYRAIQKYGWVNFKHEIIYAGLTEEEARKIEKETIVALQAYDEKYGYNTQVGCLEGEKEDIIVANNKGDNKKESKLRTEKNTKIRTYDLNQVAQSIIEALSIKTYGDTLFWLQDGQYIHSSNIYKKIEKELLITYGLSPNKHKDIIKRIKILSVSDFLNPVLQKSNEQKTDLHREDIVLFCQNLKTHTFTNGELYVDYEIWTRDNNRPCLSKAAFSKIIPEVLRQLYPNTTRFRTSSTRGWKLNT